MSSAPPISIRQLTSADGGSEPFVSSMTEMVNQVFFEGEEGLLHDGVTRTDVDEIRGQILAGYLYGAFAAGGGSAAEASTQLLGCMRLRPLQPPHAGVPSHPASSPVPAADVAEFGFLAVPAEHRRGGLAKKLALCAEHLAKERGFKVLLLELLQPKVGGHPFKDFLMLWYRRLGYVEVNRLSVAEFLPHKAHICARDCEFVVYEKTLV